MKIFDLLGRQIEELVDNDMDPGAYEVRWIPNVASGVYFYRMAATPTNKSVAPFIQTRMLVYLK
jgi:hypothetical protein